jgi:hypothetical protein
MMSYLAVGAAAAPAALSGDQLFWVMVLNLVLIWGLKIVVFIVGYRIVRLAVDLLQQGIRGEFTFKGSLSGAKADLRSSSPGIFFTFVGLALIVAALLIRTTTPYRHTVEDPIGIADESRSVPAPPLPEASPFRSEEAPK